MAIRMKIYWFYFVFCSLLSSTVLADPLVVNPLKEDEKIDPVEAFERAEKAMERADINDALFLLRASAYQNYTPAQVRLGEYFDYAEFNEDAVGWFLMSAFQGNVEGAFGLAKMYANGEGIEKSDEKAFFWFRFAAERNHLNSVRVVERAYKHGLLGQKIDPVQAKLWEDKIPRLTAIQKKEDQLKLELEKKKIEEGKAKRKAAQEEADRKLLELKALEEAQSKKPSDSAPK